MTLQYSEINFDNNINDKNNLKLPDPPKLTQNKGHNQTKKSQNYDMSDLFDKIHKKDQLDQFENCNDDCKDNNLSDFKPLPPVEPVQMVKPNQYHLQQPNQERVSLEEKVNNYNESYYASIPYQNNVDQNIKNKELLHKLNYIITLLEEQKDEKTNNVIEEVILYTFLGIFIIFIIDSFARASKYVR